MKVSEVIIITIHLTAIFCKKKHRAATSESIENILYYKDCNHKQKPSPPTAMRGPPPPPQQQECKMCCTMCCGDQCVDSHQLQLGRAANQIEPKGIMPMQPDVVVTPRERRKKEKFPLPMRPSLPGRRGLAPPGFTRDNIKSLIAQDEDIRKILKDLVRVTMQKVDLMQMINNNPNAMKAKPDRADVSDSENDL